MFENINKFVFTPGHGQGDPGAVSGNRKEADNVKVICGYIDTYLKSRQINSEVLDRDNNLGLQASINEVNRRYPAFNNNSNDNYIVFEIHQDMNAPQLPDEQENGQMGVYYFKDDDLSFKIADGLCKKFISYGAYNVNDNNLGNFAGTWRQDHYLDWAGYHLGFINFTKPLAMIIECGYISGRNSDEDLQEFALWIARAIYELKTGKRWDSNNNPVNNNNSNQNMSKARETIGYERLLANQKLNSDRVDFDIRAAVHGWRGEDPEVKLIPDFEFLVNDLIIYRNKAAELTNELIQHEDKVNELSEQSSEKTALINQQLGEIKTLNDKVSSLNLEIAQIKEKQANTPIEHKVEEKFSFQKLFVGLSKAGVLQNALTTLPIIIGYTQSPEFAQLVISYPFLATIVAVLPSIYSFIKLIKK